MTKDNECHGLHKVPDHIIIKSLRTEVGKLNAYITELEDAAKENLESTRVTHLENCLAQKNKAIKAAQQALVDQQHRFEELLYKSSNGEQVITVNAKYRKLTTSEKATAATEWVNSEITKTMKDRNRAYSNFLMGMEAAEKLLMKNPI